VWNALNSLHANQRPPTPLSASFARSLVESRPARPRATRREARHHHIEQHAPYSSSHLIPPLVRPAGAQPQHRPSIEAMPTSANPARQIFLSPCRETSILRTTAIITFRLDVGILTAWLGWLERIPCVPPPFPPVASGSDRAGTHAGAKTCPWSTCPECTPLRQLGHDLKLVTAALQTVWLLEAVISARTCAKCTHNRSAVTQPPRSWSRLDLDRALPAAAVPISPTSRSCRAIGRASATSW